MRRWTIGLLLLACGLLGASDAQAGQKKNHPRRFVLGSNFEYQIKPGKNGQPPRSEVVYPGYRQHMAPPAWLYYGYPHSMDGTYGTGIYGPGF